jgi:PAS domain S-box-containing protein
MKKASNGRGPLPWLQILVTASTLAGVALAIYLGQQSHREMQEMATRQFNQQQLILARSAAAGIEAYFQEFTAELSSLTNLPEVQQMGPECLQHLQHAYWGFPPRTSIRLLDRNGILRFIYPFDGWRGELIGRDYSQEAFFQEAKETGRPGVSQLMANERDETRTRIAVPIYSTHEAEAVRVGDEVGVVAALINPEEPESGEFRGVLVGSFDPYVIAQDFVSPIVSAKTGYAWLLDNEGIFLAHPEERFVGRNAFEVRAERAPEISLKAGEQIQQRMIAGEEGTGRYVSGEHRGQKGEVEELIAFTPVHMGNHTWSVAVCAPLAEVQETIRTSRRSEQIALAMVILALVAGGLFLFITSCRWSRSLTQEVARQTKELKETRDYLHNLIRYANAPIIVWSPDRQVTIFNKAFEEMSGRTEAEMLGQQLDVLFPKESRSASLEKIERAAKGEYWETVEIPILGTDGKVRLALWNSANIYAEDGKTLIATIAQGQDITDRVQAEEQTRLERDRFQGLLAAIGDGVDVITSDYRVTYTNDQLKEIVGKDELAGRLCYEVFLDRSAPCEECSVRRAIESGRTETDEILLPNGRSVEVSSSPLRLPSGEMAAIKIVRDVTERRRAEEALERRATQLATLGEVGQQIASWLELDPLLDRLVNLIREAFNYRYVSIFLADSARGELALMTGAGYDAGPAKTLRLRVGEEGICGWVAGSGEPLLVGDVTQEPRYYPLDVLADTRSELAVPIRVKGQVIGVLDVQSAELEAFDEDDLFTLQTLADQVAVAIENARLFEAERQTRRLSDTLSEIARELNLAPNLSEALDLVLARMEQVIAFDSGSILLLEDGKMSVAAVRGFETPEQVLKAQLDLDISPLNREVIETRRPLILGSVADDPRWLEPMEISGLSPVLGDVHSWMGVPLLIQDRVIGMLTADKVEPDFYHRQDAELALAFASHAAVAIEKARLYEAEQDRRRVAETLRQASTVLSSTLELDKVLELILQQLRQVIPYDSASVQQLQRDVASPSQKECLEIVACWGFDEPGKVVGLVFPLDAKFPNSRVVTTKAPLTVGDVIQYYPHFRDEADYYHSGRIRSWLGVPLMVKGQVIGVIALDRAEVQPYTAEESELTMAFANQAAIAIENARLHQQTQRSLARITNLYELSSEILTTMTVTETAELIVHKLVQAAGAHSAMINLMDTDGQTTLRFGAAAQGALEPEPLPRPAGATVAIFRSGEPLIVTERDERSDLFTPRAIELGIQALIGLPLKAGGQVIGVLFLRYTEPHPFSPDQVQALTIYANQAATALERARLYAETRRTRDYLQSILDSSIDLIFTVKQDGAFGYFNPRLTDITGYNAGAIRGRPFLDLIPEDRRALMLEKWQELSQGRGGSYETEIINAQGQRIPVLVSQSAVEGFDEVLVILRDIAQVKQSEQEIAQLLQQSRQQAEDLTLLYEAGQLFSSSLQQEEVFQEISRRCVKALNVDVFLLRLIEDERLVVKGSFCRRPEEQEEVERLLEDHPIRVGEGIAGRVAQTGEPTISDGAPVESLTLPGYVDFLRSRKWLLVPMKVKDKVIGVLTFITSDPKRSFLPRDLALAQGIANQAAVAIENARLYEEAKRWAEEMTSLYNVGVATTSTLSLDKVLQQVCEQVGRLMNVSSLYIALYDAELDELHFEIVTLFLCKSSTILFDNANRGGF